MGSSWSQLKKAMERGDEQRCLDLYQKHPELRRRLTDARALFDPVAGATFVHASAQRGMARFLARLLEEPGANPNALNRSGQNALHACCDATEDARQHACLQVLLRWHARAQVETHPRRPGRARPLASVEINLNEQDVYENTPLHYAAMRNLTSCVQSLVAHGAFLFVENIGRCTPCDLAEKHGSQDISLFLEAKMALGRDDAQEGDELVQLAEEGQSPQFGLGVQELLAEKDRLLQETASALDCSVFTAEAMLRKHAWSKELLLEAWAKDPAECCAKCGISSLSQDAVDK
jgi:ankyrin repeat protein